MSSILHPISNRGHCNQTVTWGTGPAEVHVTQHCVDNAEDIIISCADQRNPLDVSFQIEYQEITNQCSSRPSRYERTGYSVEVKISLGDGFNRNPLLHHLVNGGFSRIEPDPNNPEYDLFHSHDDAGAQLPKYQVIVLPVINGIAQIHNSLVLPYAEVMTESYDITFGPSEQKAVDVKFYAEDHPDPNVGRSYWRRKRGELIPVDFGNIPVAA